MMTISKSRGYPMSAFKIAAAAYQAHKPAADAAFALFRRYCNGTVPPRVPGMDTAIRLAYRIALARRSKMPPRANTSIAGIWRSRRLISAAQRAALAMIRATATRAPAFRSLARRTQSACRPISI